MYTGNKGNFMDQFVPFLEYNLLSFTPLFKTSFQVHEIRIEIE